METSFSFLKSGMLHLSNYCKKLKPSAYRLILCSLKLSVWHIVCPAASARRGHRAIGLSVRTSIQPKTRFRFLAKVESQDLLMLAS